MREALNSILHNAEGLGSASLFLFLLTIFILLGLWSGLGRMQVAQILRGPSASNLFLTVQMHASSLRKRGDSLPADDFTGHVTSLNVRRAEFVSPIKFSRGDRVTLDLGALPDFPAAPAPFSTKVKRCEVIRGKPASFLVEVEFVDTTEPFKSPLSDYLGRLVGASRLAAL